MISSLQFISKVANGSYSIIPEFPNTSIASSNIFAAVLAVQLLFMLIQYSFSSQAFASSGKVAKARSLILPIGKIAFQSTVVFCLVVQICIMVKDMSELKNEINHLFRGGLFPASYQDISETIRQVLDNVKTISTYLGLWKISFRMISKGVMEVCRHIFYIVQFALM